MPTLLNVLPRVERTCRRASLPRRLSVVETGWLCAGLDKRAQEAAARGDEKRALVRGRARWAIFGGVR